MNKKTICQRIRDFFNQKVLLCDLDGTLIETKSGKTFPVDNDDWKFKPWIKEAIQEYNPRYIFIISNQGGIEKGYVKEVDFIKKLNTIKDEIRSWGDFIVDGTYAISNDPNNQWRKPNVGMVIFFKHDYYDGYDFDNRQALMIGDASGLEGSFSDTDLQTARNAKIRYADVNQFIEAMCPCKVCQDLKISCLTGEGYEPLLPCSDSKRARLREILLYKP